MIFAFTWVFQIKLMIGWYCTKYVEKKPSSREHYTMRVRGFVLSSKTLQTQITLRYKFKLFQHSNILICNFYNEFIMNWIHINFLFWPKKVVMHSKHSGGKMFFHTDLRGRGPAEIIDIPPHSDVYLIPPNDTFTNRDASLKDRNVPSRALPSNGFRYWILLLKNDII